MPTTASQQTGRQAYRLQYTYSTGFTKYCKDSSYCARHGCYLWFGAISRPLRCTCTCTIYESDPTILQYHPPSFPVVDDVISSHWFVFHSVHTVGQCSVAHWRDVHCTVRTKSTNVCVRSSSTVLYVQQNTVRPFQRQPIWWKRWGRGG